LVVAGVGALLGVELLPPQPTAATENARTAARTSIFFMDNSGNGGLETSGRPVNSGATLQVRREARIVIPGIFQFRIALTDLTAFRSAPHFDAAPLLFGIAGRSSVRALPDNNLRSNPTACASFGTIGASTFPCQMLWGA